MATKCRTSAPVNQLRGISRVVSTGFTTRHVLGSTATTAINSRRFAANSPQVDEELTQFLKSEIELEKKSQTEPLPQLKGWSVATDGSNLTFTKTYGSEQIAVRANVNHSVDTRGFNEDVENPEQMSAPMVCRPDFAVEIKKGNRTLGINCSFVDLEDVDGDDGPQGTAGGQESGADAQALEDEFQINELSIYEGEFKDSSYLVAGDVMDGSMYDLMMDLLHERGVDQEFAKQLIDYTTVYDHTQYVGLLEKLRDFVAKK
ncbi:unnamed protein product [Oppiella nova]|uniref:Complement component 1 Q subcomponent-binding protein, mitochondrial n=1 Tax=Oppiella nova TaxID=334625 RepID=A0A7R9R0Z4_9ACAR|nr:unnamed protein product [Oppiella nova]CAG2181533.1 unnamed protein product [Oppiella nova]